MNKSLKDLEQEISDKLALVFVKYTVLLQLGADKAELDCLLEELKIKIKNIATETGKNAQDLTNEELVVVGEKILNEIEILEEKIDEIIEEKRN